MDRLKQLSTEESIELYTVSRALASMARIQILKLLQQESYNVAELAEILKIPASTTGIHVRILEDAGLIKTQLQPGAHGSAKVCGKITDQITIRLLSSAVKERQLEVISMPIGVYTDCQVSPTCGLAGEHDFIGMQDDVASFYQPERVNAQMLWTSSGYVEYRFPKHMQQGAKLRKLAISMEICSEAPNFREDWMSEITLWINGVDCGTWLSPGDFGSRKGVLTPSYIKHGNTQYGLLTTWEVDTKGSMVNENRVEDASIDDLRIDDFPYITVRVGNKDNAKYRGGFNLFGKKAGDYQQDIMMMLEFE